MGQLLLRNVDDDLIDTLKRRAVAAGTSMEAEARAALKRGIRLSTEEKRALARELQAQFERAKVAGVVQTPGWMLIREGRDER